MKSKNLRRTEQCLKATRLPYEIACGSNHVKIFLAGKMVGVLSHNGNSGPRRDTREIEKRIKQRVDELRGGNERALRALGC